MYGVYNIQFTKPMLTKPIEIDASIQKHLKADVLQALLAGECLNLPGKMVWHRWGPEGAPTVVLLHGGSGSWTHWIHTIAPLVADGFRVLAIDLPGFGDSEAPEKGGDVDALIEPLHAAWQSLQQNTFTTFVGFSFGGMAAALWLAAYPKDAQNLVMVGAPGLGLNAPNRIPLKGWRHLPTAEMQAEAHRHNLLVLMLHDAANLNELAMAVHQGNVQRDRMPRRRLSLTPIVAEVLPRIQCPLQVIYGEFDALYKERMHEVEAMFKNTSPHLGSWQLVLGAGHWVQFEDPPGFQKALKTALQSI